MPVRSRQKATEQAESSKLYSIPGFDFNKPLSWRPGKAIPVSDLLLRLHNLGNALRSYEEDQVDPQTFAPLATDLANTNLLGHKDKGVRAWALSCVVDVLKICAPDAPFSDTGLKDIFTVFINSILPALADPSNAYNNQHVYVLHSFSESQSILLLADVPENEALVTNLFTHGFDIFANTGNGSADMEVSKSVEFHLKNLLCTVVEEVDLPQEVTDIIISQFLRVDVQKPPAPTPKSKKQPTQDKSQSTLLLKDYPPAYNMAKSICTTCQEKMTSQISQYFNAIIVDAGAKQSHSHAAPSNRRFSTMEDSEDEGEEGLADLKKAHRLLRELWRACPDVLINVIPQVEAELSADTITLRKLATETLGDIAAGIGIAGLAPSSELDPSAYPLPSITESETERTPSNPLLTPASPKPFTTVHRTVFENFIGRSKDKDPSVRAAWAGAVARIVFTAAGGIGLGEQDLLNLLAGYAQVLRDPEEHVRLAGIRGLAVFTYHGLVNVVGADGGLSKTESVFSALAERFTDRKHVVRDEAMAFGARLWGTASRDLEEGVDAVVTVVGDFSTHLLSAYYTNDPSIHALLDKVLYESIFPLSFPPIKSTAAPSSSQRRRMRDAEGSSQEITAPDPDVIRARRILTFIRGLDIRSKQVFTAIQGRQVQMSKGMTVFLKACEEYNAGIVEPPANEVKIKAQLKTYIEALSKPFPDAARMTADLWKFAEQHNRRDYQLLRFVMGPEHDYRTVQKAIKELTKRIRESPASSQALLDSLMQLVYRCALIVYNRSHVPAIMEISRTDEHGLASTAHEILQEISSRNPEVLKTHIRALCKELEESSPSAVKPENPSAPDTLKACAHFARKYPSEVTGDRKFLTSLTHFALFSKSPRAAKHAVSILLTIANKKEMYAKEILSKALADAKPSSPYFLARLAAIAQACLLSAPAANSETDAVLKLALVDTLQQTRSPSSDDNASTLESPPSEEMQAKELALKILVNRCRSEDEKENAEEFDATAKAVIKILMHLITSDGEMTPAKNTPTAQRNHLRLLAVRFVLKLCSHKRRCEELVSPAMFHSLTLVLIKPPNAVRTGFVNQLKKYLGHNRIGHRWFTALFLLPFEPDFELKSSAITWLRSRVQYFERQQQQVKLADKKTHQNVMELTFARLISLLVHHPDYPDKDADGFDMELLDFSKYIVFYLIAVATEQNLSLIFHIAQRIKQTRDNITGSEESSERLYVLSDLSQAVIRNYADMMQIHAKGNNLLQTWPGHVSIPRSLFKALPNHDAAQAIVEKNYLPEETALGLEKLIKDFVRSTKGKQAAKRAVHIDKKRKSGSVESEDEEEKRRAPKKKKASLPIRKTPKPKRKGSPAASSAQPSRKSARVAMSVSYVEADSGDEPGDAEMDEAGHLQSSPAISKPSRKGKRPSSAHVDPIESDSDHEDEEGEHTPIPNDADHPEADVIVHEDEDAGQDDEFEEDIEMSEREPTPSPLKEKENPAVKKSKKKTKSTPSKKAVKEPPARRTRQTRSTRP